MKSALALVMLGLLLIGEGPAAQSNSSSHVPADEAIRICRLHDSAALCVPLVFLKVIDAQITFEVDGEGRAARLILHQNGAHRPAKRIE